MLLLGVGQLVDLFLSLGIIYNIEITAAGAGGTHKPPNLGLIVVEFLPIVGSSLLMVCVGAQHLATSNGLVDRTVSVVLIVVHIAAFVLHQLLFRLDTVVQLCSSKDITIMASTTILTAEILSTGIMHAWGANWSSMFVILLAGCALGSTTYLVMRRSLAGHLGVRTGAETSMHCALVLEPSDSSDQFDIVTLGNSVVSGVLVLHFALVQYIFSRKVKASLDRLQRTKG